MKKNKTERDKIKTPAIETINRGMNDSAEDFSTNNHSKSIDAIEAAEAQQDIW